MAFPASLPITGNDFPTANYFWDLNSIQGFAEVQLIKLRDTNWGSI